MNAIEQIFGPTTPNKAAAPKKELGQEDFLKLLVAQLKNQDPNNPAENGEFLGQIAQFSMVSGIDDLGVSFDGVAGSINTGQGIQAAQLVGKQVLVETNTAALAAGEPVEGFLELVDGAAATKLQIHDAAGSLITEIDLGSISPGMQKFSWGGLKEDGTQAATGEYQITAQGLVNGKLEAVPVHIFSKVESVSVDSSNTNVLLHLAGNKNVGISEIREYR